MKFELYFASDDWKYPSKNAIKIGLFQIHCIKFVELLKNYEYAEMIFRLYSRASPRTRKRNLLARHSTLSYGERIWENGFAEYFLITKICLLNEFFDRIIFLSWAELTDFWIFCFRSLRSRFFPDESTHACTFSALLLLYFIVFISQISLSHC